MFDYIKKLCKKKNSSNILDLYCGCGSISLYISDVVSYVYDYKKENMDFILQSFPNVIKSDEIVDLNGAGDAFLGGFLSQYMQGKKLTTCCKAGNDAASVILKNIGCTFTKNAIIHFRD